METSQFCYLTTQYKMVFCLPDKERTLNNQQTQKTMKTETKSSFFLHLALLQDASGKQLHERVHAVVLDTPDSKAFERYHEGDYTHLKAIPIAAPPASEEGVAAANFLQAALKADATGGGAYLAGVLDEAMTTLVQAAAEYTTVTIGADVKEAVECEGPDGAGISL